MDEPRLVDSISDILKWRPIVVRQIRTVFQGSDPPGFRLVEMQFVRVVASHIRRADKGLKDRTAGGKHRVPVFIGENTDPGPGHHQKSGDDNCSGSDRLPQTALVDGNV